jgi:hypothetical protein
MRTCLSCRAALREFRATPDRVAGALPPVVAVTADGPWRGLLEGLVGAAQQKSAAVGDRLHAAAELAAGQKVAAVAASAAALAGGGTALDELANHRGPPRAAQVQQERHEPVKDETPVRAAPVPEAPVAEVPATASPETAPPAPEPAAPPAPPPAEPDPANEFMPTPAAQPAPTPSGPPPAHRGAFEPAGAGGGGSGGSSASGEFAP